MPNDAKKITREQAEAREELLRDRLAICLSLLKQRHGDDWNPWYGEAMWEDADGLGEVLRASTEYTTARKVVNLFIERSER